MVGPGRRDRDVVEILTDTGRLAVERRRLRLGVELYALAVQKAGPRTPQADRLRVEIIRRLESVRAWPLLAEQCDVCLDDLGDVSDADRAFVVATRLRALAEVDATTSLATAIDRALADGRLASRRADLLLLKWRHLRKEGKGQAAAKVLKAFLEEYPNDPRAAELFYAVAVDCLASEQYEEARSILRTLRERFPHAAQAEWAETLLGRLSRIHTSARAPTTNAK